MTLPRPDTEQSRRHALRFTQPENWPMLARFPVDASLTEQLIAQMFGCEPSEIAYLAGELRDEVATSARALLAQDGFARDVAALPFRDGDRVVAVGDSVSADRLGWFELLRESVRQLDGRPIAMVNQSISGDTTTSAIERLDLLAAAEPDHVLVMLGTNDARRHGSGGAVRMVSATETHRNLEQLCAFIGGELGAQAHLITPPACDHGRVAQFFAGAPVSWNGNEVDEVVGVVRKVDPKAIDIADTMRRLSPAEFADVLEADGIHPTAAGQQLLARRIATALASG